MNAASKVGFTGTRTGLTTPQSDALTGVLTRMYVAEFHHGDCVGADAEAAALVRIHAPRATVVCHPPTVINLRAHTAADVWRAPLPYLQRNQRIVEETDVLLAAPCGEEDQHSGTWRTIRYAKSSGRPVVTVWPSGAVTRFAGFTPATLFDNEQAEAGRARTGDPATSQAGARSVAFRAGSQKARLLACYIEAGPFDPDTGQGGLTADEAGKMSGLAEKPNCCYWKRCGELEDDHGFVGQPEGGPTRPGNAGDRQIVRAVTEAGLAAAEALYLQGRDQP